MVDDCGSYRYKKIKLLNEVHILQKTFTKFDND